MTAEPLSAQGTRDVHGLEPQGVEVKRLLQQLAYAEHKRASPAGGSPFSLVETRPSTNSASPARIQATTATTRMEHIPEVLPSQLHWLVGALQKLSQPPMVKLGLPQVATRVSSWSIESILDVTLLLQPSGQ